MSTYTIGEVAERTGFSASSLRYYEGIGLVSPAARTDAGYRLYDDRTLCRLDFIARAKQLGCSLEEIADLAGIWDGERCGPVQRRFHEIVTGKIGAARRQIADLVRLNVELRQAAARLSAPPIDGPCGDDCACLAATADTGAGSAEVHSPAAGSADPVLACSLTPDSMANRLDEWQDLLGHATRRVRTADGRLRVSFDPSVDAADLARLVAAEQQCCAFLSFAITVDERGLALEVRAPDSVEGVVSELFGTAGPAS